MLNLVLKPNNNPIPNDTHPYLSNEKPHSDKNQPYMDPLTKNLDVEFENSIPF